MEYLRRMWNELTDVFRPEAEKDLTEEDLKQEAARQKYYSAASESEIADARLRGPDEPRKK